MKPNSYRVLLTGTCAPSHLWLDVHLLAFATRARCPPAAVTMEEAMRCEMIYAAVLSAHGAFCILHS